MLTFDTLPDKVKDNYKRNITSSVAFVKADGTVRHIAFRRNLNSYIASDKPKSEKQANVQANNNLLLVVDTNAYIKALKGSNGDKAAAAKKAWRNIKLGEVLAFMASGEVFDMREENNILERYGEEIYSQLTPNMKAALMSDINQSSDVDKYVIEPAEGSEEEVNDNLKESDMYNETTDNDYTDDIYNPEIDYEEMISKHEDEEDGKHAMKTYDDFESGAIYETITRMKKLINH